jgi:site-specific DNA-methyltransferase (adenine-specific)
MIIRDHFQNYKGYAIPKAQLIIADIPYNLGNNAYASNPAWYKDGDNSNGESELAGKSFFDTDEDFRPAEFMHFCSTMLKADPKKTKVEGEKRQKSEAACMIIFCAFDQQMYLIELGKRYGLNNYINLVFRKNFSAQVLKANMKVVGNCEYGLILYRDRLPKFRNYGKMIFNCMDWPRDNESEKIHPTQKPIELLKKLIEIFTDEGDVVIDPCAGSGSTIVAALQLNRKGYGFEIKKDFYTKAKKWIEEEEQKKKDLINYGFNKTEIEKTAPTLWTL